MTESPQFTAPTAPSDITQEERTTAMMAHVLSLFTGFLGPLVIYFTKRKSSRFVAFHALQASLWHLGLVLTMFAAIGAIFASMFAGGWGAPSGGAAPMQPPTWVFGSFFAIWAIVMLSWVFSMGYSVYIGVQANSGRWARYPWIGRWAERRSGT